MNTELIQGIYARRSLRKYTDEPVSSEHLRTLLEAAMAAPSAGNQKPWHFIVIDDREMLNELAEGHRYGKMLFEALLCIAVCGDTAVSGAYWVQDCSAATENLLLAAEGLGLGAVWLGVHPTAERVSAVSQALGIPEGIVPLNLISIGHPAEQKAARTQYDEARVHHGRW